MIVRAFKAGVNHIWSEGGLPDAGQAGRWCVPQGKEGVGQWLVFATRRPEAKAGNDPLRIDRHDQVKAFIPAQTIAPADVSEARQPAGTTPFSIPCCNTRAIQGFVSPLQRIQHVDQMQGKGTECVSVLAQQAVELRTLGQRRKRGSQMTLGVPVEIAFALEPCPLAKVSLGRAEVWYTATR